MGGLEFEVGTAKEGGRVVGADVQVDGVVVGILVVGYCVVGDEGAAEKVEPRWPYD